MAPNASFGFKGANAMLTRTPRSSGTVYCAFKTFPKPIASHCRGLSRLLYHFRLKKELFLASEISCTPPGWNDLFYVEMVLPANLWVMLRVPCRFGCGLCRAIDRIYAPCGHDAATPPRLRVSARPPRRIYAPRGPDAATA